MEDPGQNLGDEIADDYRSGFDTAKKLGLPSKPSRAGRSKAPQKAPEGVSNNAEPFSQPNGGISSQMPPAGSEGDSGTSPGEDPSGSGAPDGRKGRSQPRGKDPGSGSKNSWGDAPSSSVGQPAGSVGTSDVGSGVTPGTGSSAGGEGSSGFAGAASGSAGAAGESAAGATAGSAAGAGTGTAAAAATGAAAGVVGGPAGIVAGAFAGILMKPILKALLCLVAFLAVLIIFFMSVPSFLFDNPDATSDRQVLEQTYNEYYTMISNEYLNDIWRAENAARDDTKVLFAEAGGSASGFYNPPSLYPHIKMQQSERNKLESFLSSSDYDSLVFHNETLFLRTVTEYEKAAQSNINLVLSLIDTQKKNWFSVLFEGIADEITDGWYSKFTTWVGAKWEGFWQDFIHQDLYSITVGDTWIEEIEYHTPDGLPYYKRIAHVTIDYTYDLKDRGVAFYANKMGADQDQIDRAAEMSNFLADLFGSSSDEYFGFWVDGGYYTDAIQGGTVGNNIANALEKLKDKVAGMEYDPGGNFVFPLQGYDQPLMSSHYGPREFASDPWHTGVDFAAPTGTPILAATDGIVLFTAQMPNGFGNYIVVYHGDYNGEPVATMYGHMSAFGSYKAGDQVSAGDVIGYVGSTGLSTGPHLHFQLHVGDVTRNPVEFFEFLSYLRPYD